MGGGGQGGGGGGEGCGGGGEGEGGGGEGRGGGGEGLGGGGEGLGGGGEGLRGRGGGEGFGGRGLQAGKGVDRELSRWPATPAMQKLSCHRCCWCRSSRSSTPQQIPLHLPVTAHAPGRWAWAGRRLAGRWRRPRAAEGQERVAQKEMIVLRTAASARHVRVPRCRSRHWQL